MSKRVFVLESAKPLTDEAAAHIRSLWEFETAGTEIEGSKVLILGEGLKLYELTGEGLANVSIDENGKVQFAPFEGEEG